jgi:hypothetical protein
MGERIKQSATLIETLAFIGRGGAKTLAAVSGNDF